MYGSVCDLFLPKVAAGEITREEFQDALLEIEKSVNQVLDPYTDRIRTVYGPVSD